MANDLREDAWKLRHPDMQGATKHVLVRLCDRANTATHETFVGVQSLAEDCGLSRPTVMKAISDLIAVGLVEEARPAIGRRPRTLRVIADALARCGQTALPQLAQREPPLWSIPAPVAVNTQGVCGQVSEVCGQTALHESLNPEPLESNPTVADAPASGTELKRPEWKVYAGIGKSALERALREYKTHDDSTVADLVKAACADQRIYYDGEIATKVVSGALYAWQKAKEKFEHDRAQILDRITSTRAMPSKGHAARRLQNAGQVIGGVNGRG